MECSAALPLQRFCSVKVAEAPLKANVSGDFRELSGGCAQDRTVDPLIKSQLLYQLSYTPKTVANR